MNLSEERNYQKLLDTLEALGLTEKNRKLAEAYFAQGTGEQPELLKKAELQDFSGLAPEKKKKSIDYVEHLKKRKKTEELARYVHFAAAVGGSTASYLLSQYNWNLKDVLPYLSPEQEAAILAEGGAAPKKLILKNLGKTFQPEGTVPQLQHRAGIDAAGIAQAILEAGT